MSEFPQSIGKLQKYSSLLVHDQTANVKCAVVKGVHFHTANVTVLKHWCCWTASHHVTLTVCYVALRLQAFSWFFRLDQSLMEKWVSFLHTHTHQYYQPNTYTRYQIGAFSNFHSYCCKHTVEFLRFGFWCLEFDLLTIPYFVPRLLVSPSCNLTFIYSSKICLT